jgi:hypothetical protein
LSQYIFRGTALSEDSVVFQPSIAATYKGFTLSLWGNMDTNDKHRGQNLNWNETDITLSYARELFPGLTANVGAIYYALESLGVDPFTGQPVPIKDTAEVYAGLGYVLPWFNVGLTAFRDVGTLEGWWVQFDVSKNIPLSCYNMSIDLAANVGYENFNSFLTPPILGDEYWAGQFLAALNIPVFKVLTFSPRIGVAFPVAKKELIEFLSVDGNSTHVFGGIRLSAAF